MIAVIDYDAGNIRSVMNALKKQGCEAVLTDSPQEIRAADHVILPGVGAFGDAMEKLDRRGLVDVIRGTVKAGTPLLGICLGQQLLFDSSEETPGAEGLGLIHGTCRRIPDGGARVPVSGNILADSASDCHRERGLGIKVPQIGWNDLSYPRPGRLFADVPEHSYVYFVHSYYVVPDDPGVVTAVTEYGAELTASVEQGNLFACQFHPEKSAEVGQQILRNFLKIK